MERWKMILFASGSWLVKNTERGYLFDWLGLLLYTSQNLASCTFVMKIHSVALFRYGVILNGKTNLFTLIPWNIVSHKYPGTAHQVDISRYSIFFQSNEPAWLAIGCLNQQIFTWERICETKINKVFLCFLILIGDLCFKKASVTKRCLLTVNLH